MKEANNFKKFKVKNYDSYNLWEFFKEFGGDIGEFHIRVSHLVIGVHKLELPVLNLTCESESL